MRRSVGTSSRHRRPHSFLCCSALSPRSFPPPAAPASRLCHLLSLLSLLSLSLSLFSLSLSLLLFSLLFPLSLVLSPREKQDGGEDAEDEEDAAAKAKRLARERNWGMWYVATAGTDADAVRRLDVDVLIASGQLHSCCDKSSRTRSRRHSLRRNHSSAGPSAAHGSAR